MSEPSRGERVPRFLVVASEVAWRVLVVLAALAAVAWIVIQLKIVMIPFGVALLIAGVLAPPTTWLKERGLPPLAAAWIVTIAAAAVVGGILWFATSAVAAEISRIGTVVDEGWRRLLEVLRGTPLAGVVGNDPLAGLGGGGGELVNRILSGAASAAEILTMIVLTPFFTFFLIKDGDRLFALFLRQLDRRDTRRTTEEAGLTTWQTLSRYFRGMALIALINALLTGLALWLIGVPLILVLMLITFVGSFIPYAGAIIASAVAALVALTSGGLVDAALVVLAAVLVQQLEGNVLEPIIMGRAMHVHPLVILAAVTAGAAVAGLPGAFFAVPIVATAAALYTYARERGT